MKTAARRARSFFGASSWPKLQQSLPETEPSGWVFNRKRQKPSRRFFQKGCFFRRQKGWGSGQFCLFGASAFGAQKSAAGDRGRVDLKNSRFFREKFRHFYRKMLVKFLKISVRLFREKAASATAAAEKARSEGRK